MAKITNITKKKKADKQTALLALAADRTVTAGECLTSEEMSGLVEENFDRSRRRGLFAHLAHCEDCYEEWLVLRSKLLQEQEAGQTEKEGTILPFFSRPRNLAIFGSALAAVASVVLVVNIQLSKQPIVYHEEQPVIQRDNRAIDDREHQIDIAGKARKSQQISRQQDRYHQKQQPVKKPAAPQQVKKKDITPGIVPMPDRQKDDYPDVDQQAVKKKSGVQAPLQTEAETSIPTGAGQVDIIREEKMMSPEPLPLGKRSSVEPGTLSKKTAISIGASIKKPEQDAVVLLNAAVELSTTDWLEQVEEGCKNNRYDERLWKRLVVSAKRIIQQRQQDDVIDERFVKVFDRVKEMKEQGFRELCAEVQGIIRKK